MHIYRSKIGDQFYFDNCIWTITGELEEVRYKGKIDVFRECYNHDTMEFYSLHALVFSHFQKTEWSE